MSTSHAAQRIATRDSILGEGMRIRRALPARERRLIGAWCFLDHFGPIDISQGDGMRVGPHPHIGLQTFTWPISGEILHRDSLGYTQVIRPGQVNLMTAGRGISHSEESPPERSPQLHGAQLWIALPDTHRHIAPAFQHYPEIPATERDGFRVTVMAGDWLGLHSPVELFSPLVGAELLATTGGTTTLPLQPTFEHGLLVLEGIAVIDGETLEPGTLLYLPPGDDSLNIQAGEGMRLLLIGGEPFPETPLLWWNFVARDKDEISTATREWNHGTAFGTVEGYDGQPLTAPAPPWMTTD